MTAADNIGVIILAAGASRRLGRPKQLVTFRGKTLLQHVIDTCNTIPFATSVMVLGAHVEDILKQTNTTDFATVLNQDWALGMGRSISTGLQEALQLNPALTHVLILLSDQPYLTEEHIIKLITTHLEQKKPVTASYYGDTTGVPAVFSKEIFTDLLALSEDKGARQIIRSYNTARVAFAKGEVDIDNAEDLERLR